MVRIELPRYTERFGSVRIHAVQKLWEIDSGKSRDGEKGEDVIKVEREALEKIESSMTVVIPVKNEKLKLLEGVLSGIPHDCFVVIVSNSPRVPIDRYKMEMEAVSQFCHFVKRPALIIHQRDRALATAFAESGYGDIVSPEGVVFDGKAEGMIVGIALTKSLGKEYVGFIDADNYVPGAVHEYVKIYGAAFCMARTPYSMARISWVYKPKVSEAGFYFKKWGRISEFTNRYLNSILASYTGFETEIVKTGSSGEHAMSMKLAELLPYSSGYTIEPYEFLAILEEFGGIKPTPHLDVMEQGVDIFQVETRNPHFHEDKGDVHIHGMLLTSLASIYHSPLCSEGIRQTIREELASLGVIKREDEIQKPRLLPSPSALNAGVFKRKIEAECESLKILGA